MRKPKFRLGQVVSLRSYFGNFSPGQTGPGYAGKPGWRHGWQFGKIVKIMPPSSSMRKTAPFCYFLDGFYSAHSENHLRPVTKREIGAAHPDGKPEGK